MNWIYLLIAGVFEIGFTTALKLETDTGDWRYSILFLICAVISFSCLSESIKTIPLGTAYAVWTGIGTTGTALIGLIYYNEPADFWRLFFLILLVGSVAGLKLVSAH